MRNWIYWMSFDIVVTKWKALNGCYGMWLTLWCFWINNDEKNSILTREITKATDGKESKTSLKKGKTQRYYVYVESDIWSVYSK